MPVRTYGYVSSNYAAGDYAYRGSNYAAGGLFGFVGSALRTVANIGSAILPGPAGAIARGVSTIIGGGSRGGSQAVSVPPLSIAGQFPAPGTGIQIGGSGGGVAIGRFGPSIGPGAPGQPAVGLMLPGRKRRRMNVANPKALRRALRRVSGFGKLARRAKRDIGRAASAVGVRRSVRGGSPGVITRSEASRALRR